MLDIGGIGPPGGGPLIGPYIGIPGPMGPPGPIGPPGPLGGVILGPIPGGPCMGKKSPSWQLGLPTTLRPPGGGTCEQLQRRLNVSTIERIGILLLLGTQPSFSLNVFLTQ